MFELKHISREAIPRSLAKAERYRLLNEPHEAESICRDVLRTDPGNQEAVVSLLLALTDQFGQAQGMDVGQARQALALLQGDYERAYYGGIICERWGKAQLDSSMPGHVTLDWLREAMNLDEKAAALAPHGNEDAVLRWNSCGRLIEGDPRLRPRAEDVPADAGFTDEIPGHLISRRRGSQT